MDIIQNIRARAGSLKKRVVFPESTDPRILKAAQFLEEKNICGVTLIGEREQIEKRCREQDISLDFNAVQILNTRSFEAIEERASDLYERRQHKGLTQKEARSYLENELYFGASLVAGGYADGCVAGSIAKTGEVIRAAIHCIGLRTNLSTVSSIFLMAMPNGPVYTYADCGVVPYPDARQLADIAIESARTHALLTRQNPVTAMLSFSTKGSARHDRIDLVQKATQYVREKAPELAVDGELQFDAALVPEVALRKAPHSEVAGKANVFIFPNLDAGNIAYKITERLAGAVATGPILQGLARPVMDLSRGCSWEDIVNAACVSVLMGEKNTKC